MMGSRNISNLKRALAGFFALALVATMLPAAALAAPVPEADGADPLAQATRPADGDGGLQAQAQDVHGQIGTCNFTLDGNGRLTIRPFDGAATGELGRVSYNYGSTPVQGQNPSSVPWYSRRDQITSVYIASGVKGSETMTGLFYDCKNLRSVDITNLDTSNVTKIDGMFEGCTSLASFTVPNLNLNRCTSMIRMFYGCTALATVDLRYVDTSNVQRMDMMFRGCTALSTIRLDGFKTKSAKGMYQMFRDCSSLGSIDVSGFDTAGVTEMWEMFRGCSSLGSLDLSNFRTDSLNTMRDMFYGCSAVTDIDISNFKVSTGTDRGSSLFFGCNALRTVSVGENWTFAGSPSSYGTKLPTGMWVSGATGSTFSADTIASERNNVRDTYGKATSSAIKPIILTGDGTVWSRGSLGGAAFKSSAPFAEFVAVRVDGALIARANYDLVNDEGNTRVTLKVAYLESIANGTHTIDVVSTGGIARASFSVTGDASNNTILAPIEMYRLYNPNSGEHFYTGNAGEREATIAAGWNDEGVGWTAPAAGDAVYRLYNANGGEHHYTVDAHERDVLVAAGWSDEGIGWYSGGAVELSRQYNPNAFANNHNYTSSANERDTLLLLGWHDEGVAWYGVR